MSLFDRLFRSKNPADPYQTEAQFEANLARQVSMTRQGLAQLREYEGRELRLEFFFYTNNPANAEVLNSKLLKLGYESRSGESASEPRLFVTSGWTTPMRMNEPTVIELDRNHVSARAMRIMPSSIVIAGRTSWDTVKSGISSQARRAEIKARSKSK